MSKMNLGNRVVLVVKLFLVFLLLHHTNAVFGQNNNSNLQRVTFKSNPLEENLASFVKQANVNVVSVLLERRGDAYLYKLSGVYFYQQVEKYPTPYWGIWKNKTILFYSGSEVNQVCTISDTTKFDNLLQYLRPKLHDIYKVSVPNTKNVPNLSIPVEGLEWTFKVEDGKETWLRTNDGYDSREVIVPNHN